MVSAAVDNLVDTSWLEALARTKVEQYLLFSIEAQSLTISIIDEQLILSLETPLRSENSKLSSGLVFQV
jgi:hypothetical protein